MIPVIFVHQGNQDYLKIAVEQAKLRNEVVLLTGEIDYDIVFTPLYKQMSAGHGEFELFWFQRWFAISIWMAQNEVDHIFYCDSDVMLYCDINEVLASYGKHDVAIQIPHYQPPYRWSASGHVSSWSYAALSSFCNFMVEMYSDEEKLSLLNNKWEFHQQTGAPGGVCDMTLLYLWSLDHRVINNAKVIDGATFDHNINVAENYWRDEYDMEGGRKAIAQMTSGDLRGWNKIEGRAVKFHALHFQGGAKKLMEEYRG